MQLNLISYGLKIKSKVDTEQYQQYDNYCNGEMLFRSASESCTFCIG